MAAPVWERIPHKAVVFAFILAAIPFCAGKYMELHTGGAFDSGAYLYSAHRVLNGAVPGPNETVTAKAGTLLANMLGVWLFGYNDYSAKLIQMALQIAALATLFFVMRKVFGTLAAGVALVVASFYLSAPLIAKYGNVKEQYAIAFMVLGVSMLLMRHMGGKWFWGLLAGAFLAWGPMFKETGLSALIAAFIFLCLQPLLKNRSWKVTGTDLVLVVMGGVLAIAPVQIWIGHIGSPMGLNPYVVMSYYAFNKTRDILVHKAPPPPPTPAAVQDGNRPVVVPVAKPATYLEASRIFVTFKEQAARVSRWYIVLILPVSLALGSIAARFVRAVVRRFRRTAAEGAKPYEHLVLFLGLWWLIDMVFVWVSPRPWEEYYLPLCASGAVTGGYLVALYRDKLRAVADKPFWVSLGVAGLVCMIIMAWPIVFGLRTSPQTGNKYSSLTNGYVQRLGDLGGTAPWEEVAHYINKNSGPQDKIYVWGWFPGIYVESQRDSASTTLPFTSEAHVVPPNTLAVQVKDLLASFGRAKPRFLVDTRKPDTPFVYPPLEFWPFVPDSGFLPTDPATIRSYEMQWGQYLRESIAEYWARSKTPEEARRLAEEEAQRFDAMKPLREYVMANYDVVMRDRYRSAQGMGLYGPFGSHVLFVRKPSAQ
jgi:4-amino-4-deoxy-L-arabinose transferase-like glycosyltransferase